MPVAVAGALVVAVAVIGALRAAQSRARSGAPLVGSADGSPAARARPAARTRGAARPLSPPSRPTSAPAGARRPRRRCGAPARCWARATCACRSPARCCATARARWTPRSACCARSWPTTTARPCPRSTSGSRCSGPGSAPRRRPSCEETRSLDPDGLYGRTADNVLHPSYRKNYPLWVRSRFVHGSLPQLRARAVAAPRSLRGAARLRLRAPVRLAHARAPRGGEGARARRQQHRRAGGGDRAGLRQGRAGAGGRARSAS